MSHRPPAPHTFWKTWKDLPGLFQCALVWAHTWWGPSEDEDFTRLAAFLQHGEAGPWAVFENEDLRWLVHGIRYALPTASWEDCYKAVAIFRNTNRNNVLNRCKGTDNRWRVVRTWAKAIAKKQATSVEGVISTNLTRLLKKMDPLPPEIRLRMVPPGCPSEGISVWNSPSGSWSTTGAPVILGPWRIFKTWIPFEKIIKIQRDGQEYVTTNPNDLVALRCGVEWGLNAVVGDPFHSLGVRDLPSPPEIRSYIDLDALPWGAWLSHLTQRLALEESRLFLPPPVSMPRLRTET